MRLFADENLFEPIITHLRSLSHYVLSIRDEGLSGISDDEIYKRACRENLVIITMDRDFARTFRFPPENCGGIIVVKIYKRTVEETLAIFKKIFSALTDQNVMHNLVIVSPEGVRIRRSGT
ncbi:MAG: DUF5615 family PIN-like protein [Thermodesulfovibrionales bacterium]|nr:DUF5615 family PIN-like protein [Thermodesulfovibrionales bacterium]